MSKEKRTNKESRRTHGATQDPSTTSTVDPIDRFLTQWLHIDELRTDREEWRREEDRERQAEQQERMVRMLAEAQTQAR